LLVIPFEVAVVFEEVLSAALLATRGNNFFALTEAGSKSANIKPKITVAVDTLNILLT
jgi:hypothetical protein